MGMALTPSLVDLERQRLELELNVRKLQRSLYHWRLWEAEYDGLKEEIASLQDGSSREDFLETGREFGGTLVDENEIKTLLGEGQGLSRSREQVVQLISRRIDYVQQNVTTMEKRLHAAEDKLAALLQEEPDVNNEDFPVTDIIEELDEDGMIISSSTSTPGDKAPELLGVLQKAGVKDIPDATPTVESQMGSTAQKAATLSEPKRLQELVSEPVDQANAQKDSVHTPIEVSNSSSVLMEGQQEVAKLPIADLDEPPEDAKLRREMLQYGLNEVGAIVAELEVDENASEFSIEDDYDSYGYDSEDEEEDEYGRTTRRVLTEEYHQSMHELGKQLNAHGMKNIGHDTSFLPEEIRRELEEPRVLKVESSMKEIVNSPAEKKKKKVSFAPDLDVAPTPSVAEKKRMILTESERPAVLESIVEHTEVSKEVPHKAPKKLSRFRSARSPESQNPTNILPLRHHQQQDSVSPSSSLPQFPEEPIPFPQPTMDITKTAQPPLEGRTLADTLVERKISGTSVPPEPDELDEELHRKQILAEFHNMSNRMIYRSGGFLDDDEPESVPLNESTDGKPKKSVSRFMAARMS
jgi:unconventional prefoldin RPB5 interactor 1